jgi:hypothetical protein
MSSADPARAKGGTNEIAQTCARFADWADKSRARDEACRQDFVSFIRIAFDLLSHGEPLLMNYSEVDFVSQLQLMDP